MRRWIATNADGCVPDFYYEKELPKNSTNDYCVDRRSDDGIVWTRVIDTGNNIVVYSRVHRDSDKYKKAVLDYDAVVVLLNVLKMHPRALLEAEPVYELKEVEE